MVCIWLPRAQLTKNSSAKTRLNHIGAYSPYIFYILYTYICYIYCTSLCDVADRLCLPSMLNLIVNQTWYLNPLPVNVMEYFTINWSWRALTLANPITTKSHSILLWSSSTIGLRNGCPGYGMAALAASQMWLGLGGQGIWVQGVQYQMWFKITLSHGPHIYLERKQPF